MDRSRVIFGNAVSDRAYQKAVKSKKKYYQKFGDDSQADYPVRIEKNPYIGDLLGVNNLLIGDPAQNAHYEQDADHTPLTFDREKGLSSEISVWASGITGSRWRSHPRQNRWAIFLIGWISIPTDRRAVRK